MVTPLRIGALGAARITPIALIRPARKVDEVEVTAVAARDRARAVKFASRHKIPRVHDSYEALVADPDIDAVYVPLPNSHHGRWVIAALEAGKHVLCEKPFTANATEAEAVAAVANSSNQVVMEAFHYRYHPLVDRCLQVIAEDLGEVRTITTKLCIPLPPIENIRWRLDLAGGAMMDVGGYTAHLMRTLAGAEPEIVSAVARERSPGIDRRLDAEVTFDDGRTGSLTASMLSTRLVTASALVVGSHGHLSVVNPFAPQLPHLVTLKANGRTRRFRVRGESTYICQLRAFAAACTDGTPFPTTVDDALANMRVIDACYQAAGLPLREAAGAD